MFIGGEHVDLMQHKATLVTLEEVTSPGAWRAEGPANKILKNIYDEDHNEKENKQTTLNQGTGVQCHNDSFMLHIKKSSLIKK